MVSFYNAGDQELYKKYQYLPQEQYRLSLNLPKAEQDVSAINTSHGIPATNAFTGGGDNFSVYNADPNTITNRNPNKYALQDARYANELSYVGKKNQPANPNIIPIANFDEVFGPKTFTDSLGKERTIPGEERFSFPGGPSIPSNSLYSTRTEAIKNMEMYPEYYGLDAAARKDKEPTEFQKLISRGINFIPGFGPMKRGADFLSNVISPYMPINRRAIMENQAGLDGVMINDIGQIVVGRGQAYDTPEGIMAGYNYNQMTEKTFDKRQSGIEKTLRSKYDFNDDDMNNLNKGIVTDEMKAKGFNETMDDTTNLISNYINVGVARKNFTDTVLTSDKIIDIKTDTKNQKTGDNTTTGGTPGGSPDNWKGTTYDNSAGDFKTASGQNVKQDWSDPTDFSQSNEADLYADGGRAGYFYGGRVNFKNGGLASIL